MDKLLTTILILLIATVAFTDSKAVPAAQQHLMKSSKGGAYTVEHVVDGEIIVVTNPEGRVERVRLIGIDTPESRHNDRAKRYARRIGRDLKTVILMGQEADEFLKRLLPEGQKIRLEFDVQKSDRYGRLLAYVYYQTPAIFHTFFLNAEMIRRGYAIPVTIPPNVKHADLFQELYKEALKQKRGLWMDRIAILPEDHSCLFDEDCLNCTTRMNFSTISSFPSFICLTASLYFSAVSSTLVGLPQPLEHSIMNTMNKIIFFISITLYHSLF